MLELYNCCAHFLGLRVPVKFTIRTGGQPKEYVACYTAAYRKGKLVRHDISVYTQNLEDEMRSFNELIAHELVHAWQEEQGINNPLHHCQFFVRKARELTEYLNGLGYSVDNIYLACADTT